MDIFVKAQLIIFEANMQLLFFSTSNILKGRMQKIMYTGVVVNC